MLSQTISCMGTNSYVLKSFFFFGGNLCHTTVQNQNVSFGFGQLVHTYLTIHSYFAAITSIHQNS